MDPSLIALAGAAVAAAATYLVAARQFSGRVRSTEATKLWDAATEMRREYIAQIGELRTEVREMRERVATLERERRQLLDEIAELRRGSV